MFEVMEKPLRPDAPKSLDLDGDEFRRVPTKPLAKGLMPSAAVALIGAAGGALAAAHLGGFWAALIPIPCAVWLGVALAGMYPQWFFGKPN